MAFSSQLEAPGLEDSVLSCLRYLAQRYDRPSSPVVIVSGLALDENQHLPFHQIESAAERIGLRTRPVRWSLKKFAEHHMPAILEMDGAKAVILLELKKLDGRVYDPARGEEYWAKLSSLAESYKHHAILIEPDPTKDRGIEGAMARASRDHWFWGEVFKVRESFIYVALAATVINVLAFAMPLFTMNVYDRIIPNKASASLWVLASGVVFAFAFEYMLRLSRAKLVDEVGRDVDARLSQRIFEKVMNIPLANRQGTTGSFAKRISEYEHVRDFFTSTTVVLVVDMAFVFLFLGLIILLGGLLVLVPLAGIVVAVITGFSLQKLMLEALKDAQADSGLQHSTLVEAIGGIETLKAVRAEGRMLSRWRRYADMSAATQERLRKLTAIATNMAGLISQTISIGLIIGGFYLFNAGLVSMGAIIAIVMVAGRALSPVGQFAFLMTRARQAMLTLSTLDRIMASPDERAESVRSVTPVIERGDIELQHLTFRYPEAQVDSLADISLSIRPGERIGLVGRVASGKSTLGRLLCGLYAPTGGAYLIDGLDSRQHHPHEIRRAFRYVGQDAELFSGTVRDNLVLGGDRATDEDLIAAVQRSGAGLFLSRDSAGFDLNIGERGSRLSGG
ncbi:MAG TPA: ABC transporter transmembrane domain-containing protein, partial [Caulobacteraceae bacterium]|nr:ABC transporter transmembrane domain-containing protein [Caulobacteraceae bacterium]